MKAEKIINILIRIKTKMKNFTCETTIVRHELQFLSFKIRLFFSHLKRIACKNQKRSLLFVKKK